MKKRSSVAVVVVNEEGVVDEVFWHALCFVARRKTGGGGVFLKGILEVSLASSKDSKYFIIFFNTENETRAIATLGTQTRKGACSSKGETRPYIAGMLAFRGRGV